MGREPCQKGTSVLPVVEALKAHPDRDRLVAPHLRRYFGEHLLVSGWYPERDYFALLEALVRTIDPASVGGDVWRYFAKFSVQRDIAGTPSDAKGAAGGPSDGGANAAANEARNDPTHLKGVYRNFASSTFGDPEQLFRRGVKLWSQYHDSGTMRVTGRRARTHTVVMQLVGFHIPLEGFVRLQGYYLEEFGHLVGVDLKSAVTKSTARGASYCEWEHALAATPRSDAYLATLPSL